MMVLLLLSFLGSIQHSGSKPSSSNINMNGVEIETKQSGISHPSFNEQSSQTFTGNAIRDSVVRQRQNNPVIKGGNDLTYQQPITWDRNFRGTLNLFGLRGISNDDANEQNIQRFSGNDISNSDVKQRQNNPTFKGGDKRTYDLPIDISLNSSQRTNLFGGACRRELRGYYLPIGTPNNDIAQAYTPSGWRECAIKCFLHSECQFWNYRHGGPGTPDEPQGTCFLKRYQTGVNPSLDFQGGNKACGNIFG